MADPWVRKPCPSAFFPPKASKTPENVSSPFLTQTQTKTQLLQQNPTKPPQTPPSSSTGSSHLWHIKGWALYWSFSPWHSFCDMNTCREELGTTHSLNGLCLLWTTMPYSGPQAEHLCLGSCDSGRDEFSLAYRGGKQVEISWEFYVESTQKSILELGISSQLFG